MIIWDGHDYYAHHRRFDYMSPNRKRQAQTRILTVMATILSSLTGPATCGKEIPTRIRMVWFGQPIYAAGAGRVVTTVDDGPDNREVDAAQFEANKLADYGNYIVVDHGDGEFALYGHIKQGSAKVKAGESVELGQQIAAIGASGSSLMPHLHFQLQTTAGADGEGLPSYFDHFLRVLGRRSLPVRRPN